MYIYTVTHFLEDETCTYAFKSEREDLSDYIDCDNAEIVDETQKILDEMGIEFDPETDWLQIDRQLPVEDTLEIK